MHWQVRGMSDRLPSCTEEHWEIVELPQWTLAVNCFCMILTSHSSFQNMSNIIWQILNIIKWHITVINITISKWMHIYKKNLKAWTCANIFLLWLASYYHQWINKLKKNNLAQLINSVSHHNIKIIISRFGLTYETIILLKMVYTYIFNVFLIFFQISYAILTASIDILVASQSEARCIVFCSLWEYEREIRLECQMISISCCHKNTAF